MIAKRNAAQAFPLYFYSNQKSSILNLKSKWGVQDSNLRRQSQQIYSLPRLATSVTPRSANRARPLPTAVRFESL